MPWNTHAMLRVTLRGSGLPTVTLGSGETLLFGRSPHHAVPENDPDAALSVTALVLPRCAPHVSRLLGELVVGDEIARLRWHGAGETQVSSLFDAPGGARRVTLSEGMSLLLDEGENQLVVMRGRKAAAGTFDDLSIAIDVATSEPEPPTRPRPETEGDDVDAMATAPAPTLLPQSREWYVAMALAEPWLAGTDDYPRPPVEPGDLRAGPVLERVRLEPAAVAAGRRRDPLHLGPGVRPEGRPVPGRRRSRAERPVRRRTAYGGGPTGDTGGPGRRREGRFEAEPSTRRT